DQHYRATALQGLIVRRRRCEPLERCSGGFEDLAHGLSAHSLYVAQTLGDVEDEALCGLLRQFEVARGVVAFFFRLNLVLLRDGALLDGYAALPIGEAGEREGEHQPGGEAAGKDVAPARGRLSAAPDEGLRFLRRRRRAARACCDPALGLL